MNSGIFNRAAALIAKHSANAFAAAAVALVASGCGDHDQIESKAKAKLVREASIAAARYDRALQNCLANKSVKGYEVSPETGEVRLADGHSDQPEKRNMEANLTTCVRLAVYLDKRPSP